MSHRRCVKSAHVTSRPRITETKTLPGRAGGSGFAECATRAGVYEASGLDLDALDASALSERILRDCDIRACVGRKSAMPDIRKILQP